MSSIEAILLEDIEKLKTKDGRLRAGIPHFDGFYGRDALITSWQLLRHDPSVARETLKFLARYQGKKLDSRTQEEPGKILHVYDYTARSPIQKAAKVVQRWIQGLPYYGSVDATPLFVIAAGEMHKATGDTDLLNELWPSISLATEWMTHFGDLDGDGFIEYHRTNPFGLRNQNWKDTAVYISMKAPVASVEVQGYAYMAYTTAAALARALGKDGCDWSTRAERIRERFREFFWMNDHRFFAMALDGSKNQVKEIASNSGHLLCTGILDKDDADAVASRLFEDDMFTEFGLRTHSSSSRHFRRSCTLGPIWPHDNWLAWIGLKKCGYHNQAERIRLALLNAHRGLGYLPEYYDVVDGRIKIVPRIWGVIGGPCYPQAWASGGLLNMLRDE